MTLRTRRIITPEGLPLSLEIASIGNRTSALVLDILIIFLTLILVSIGRRFLFPGTESPLVGLMFLLFVFFLINGYFIFFELYWRGVTPGKRSVGLRVISSRGGALTTSAVLARNLMRDLELLLPLSVFFHSEAYYGPAPGAAVAVASLWILIFLLMPIFNYDRARCGDLVAGTMVVVKPQGILLPDMARQKEKASYAFTNDQLQMYGIKELQVLEDVLRRQASRSKNKENQKLARLVYEKIVNKINWNDPVPKHGELDFLKKFYKAQRNFLEQRLLLGERRENKKEGRLGEN